MKRSLALGAFALVCALGPARAQTQCESLPNPVYMQIGDTQEPLIKQLGRTLRDASPPISLIYLTNGSCDNVAAIYADPVGKISTTARYVPSTTENDAWTPSNPHLACTVAASGKDIEVANSALFVSSCDTTDHPEVGLFQGPNQAYVLAVPKGSSQVAITAEEAYFVFGFGNQGQVDPWDDETHLWSRPVTKSTLLTWAANLKIPKEKMRGQQKNSSGEVLTGVANDPVPEKAIGLLGSEIYDKSRDKNVKALAFRAYQQKRAYLPDSTPTAFDKKNVRDGHYTVWSPTVWLTKVDPVTKVPVNPRAAYVIDLILNKPVTPAPAFSPLDIVISNGLVPACAMKVNRTVEGGDLSLYEPQEPCGCYYEKKVNSLESSCTECTVGDDAPCSGGKCRLGYCEAR
ncbi:MAG: hypothetical protein ACT4TC_12020 [Myxococcaceae bacterium]